MAVSSVEVPTRTPDQQILCRIIRENLINLINQAVAVYTKSDISSLSLDQKLTIALSNFLIPYAFTVTTATTTLIVFTRLPDGIPSSMRMEDFARLIQGSFVAGINVVTVKKDIFLNFLQEDYIIASRTLGV